MVKRTSKHRLGRIRGTGQLTLFQPTHLGLEAHPNEGEWTTDRQVPHKEVFAREGSRVVSSRRVPPVEQGLGVLLTLFQTHSAKHQAIHQALLLGSLVRPGQFTRTNEEVGRVISDNSASVESALNTKKLTQGNHGRKGDKGKD